MTSLQSIDHTRSWSSLLATAGTNLIELTFLKGRERLQGHDILTLIRY